MGRSPRVNFLICGVQKGGTTALFDYLGDYPDVALSDVKEVHFFDNESQDWSAPDYGAFERHFPAGDGGPCGEATPIYCYWPNALDRIAAYNPAMRLILVLRDPVERAWSHWRMETSRGAERESFSWCIRQGRQRLFEGAPWGHHREFSYVERGFYGEQVARIFDVFPRAQVLILTAEELRDEPARALAEVRTFLGLPPARTPPSRRVHVGSDAGYELAAADVAFLRDLFAADQARLRALTGHSYEP